MDKSSKLNNDLMKKVEKYSKIASSHIKSKQTITTLRKDLSNSKSELKESRRSLREISRKYKTFSSIELEKFQDRQKILENFLCEVKYIFSGRKNRATHFDQKEVGYINETDNKICVLKI